MADDKDDQKAADLAANIDPDAATVKDSAPAGSVQQDRSQDDHESEDDHEDDSRDDEFAVIVSQVDGEFVPINEYPYRLGE